MSATTQRTPIRVMRVRLHRPNEYAYAVITTLDGEYSVRLEPGMTAGGSLRKTAADLRIQAERLLRRATIIEDAEGLL